MGRTLKRVPMDFSWPMGKVWHGYINPYYARSHKCAACGGTGSSPRARLFSAQWYGKAPFDPIEYGATPLTVDHPQIQAFARRNCERSPDYYGTSDYAVSREARRLFEMWRHQWSHHLIQDDVDALLAADRLYDFTRVPRTDEQRATMKKKVAEGGNAWLPQSNGYRPTADEVNAWSLVGFGHDAINQWVCVKARCAREGIETACAVCKGEGELWINPEDKKLCEEWERSEPPTGDGFQLWETTSEGSPSSPVFATIDELCAWCETNATTFGSARASAQQWREMLDEDFVVHVSGNHVFM
jgi:hypothetical protein